MAFVGDDVTDEEVFRAYRDELTVAVMEPPRTTAAAYYLRTPRETAAMLNAIAGRRDLTRRLTISLVAACAVPRGGTSLNQKKPCGPKDSGYG